MSIGNRIKKLRKYFDLTQQKFGERIGIKGNTVAQYELEKSNPVDSVISLICREFDVNEEWLRTGEGEMFNPKASDILDQLAQKYQFSNVDYAIAKRYILLNPNKRKEILENVFRIMHEIETAMPAEDPCVPASNAAPLRIISYHQKLASAGNGQVIFEDMPVDRIGIPDIPEYKRVSYAIGVNGQSMEPLYHDGDILLIEPTCRVDVGEIGIFIVDGEAYVKKLGDGELISLNKGYKNIALTEYSNCMGRVAGKLQNN